MNTVPSAKRSGRRRVRETALGYDALGARDRADRVVRVLGNATVAALLAVSPSQPSRWRSGKERVSAQSMRALIDLDYVVSRLLMLWAPEVINDWLHGQNPHVGGRPIDVLRARGAEALRPALDAEETGAFA